MRFIFKKNSGTGKDFQAMVDKVGNCNKKAYHLAIELGGKSFRPAFGCIAGGISSICFDPDKHPDKKLWKRSGAGRHEFMPKKNSRAGKAIAKQIEDLPVVNNQDLNNILGFTNLNPFCHPGYNTNNDEYFGFHFSDDWDFIPNEDMIEITMSEWQEKFETEKQEA